MAKNSIVLIGMAGAGKSTVGRILAQRLGYSFIDSDDLIEKKHSTTLQQLLNEQGYIRLRELEEQALLTIESTRTVIATGGSAVYSERALRHLAGQALIVFLDAPFSTIKQRIGDYSLRGLAKPEDQTLEALFDERRPLYRCYANFTISVSDASPEEIAANISNALKY